MRSLAKHLVKLIFLLCLPAYGQLLPCTNTPPGSTPNLGFQLPVTNACNWGDPLNANMTALDLLLSGNSNLTALSFTNGTISGSLTFPGSIKLSAISGLTQCLHVNSAGLVSGTGSDCGSGGGGSVPTGTGFTHITSGAQDSASKSVDVSSSDITGVLKASAFPALTGDITTSAGSLGTTLATVATPGTFPKVTFNAKGLVTAGTALASGDIPNNAANTSGTASAFGATPTNCGAGVAAIGILANGNATGCFTPGGLSNPMTTLGDTIFENSTPAPARLAGNTTTVKQYLSQTGNGTISANPAWAQVNFADLGGTGTCAQEPALTGDVTSSSGSCATTLAASIGGAHTFTTALNSTTRASANNLNDVLIVDGVTYANIAAAVTAASTNPRLIIIPSSYAGTECPAAATATITFWDLRNGSETCVQNSVSWNQTSGGGLHSLERVIESRTAPASSDVAIYGQSFFTGALPAGNALDGIAGEVDTTGAVTTAGNTILSGVESDLVLGSTGGTLFQVFGLNTNISSKVGNTTNVSNAYGVYLPEYSKGGSETVTNNYGLVIEPRVAGTNNMALWNKGNSRLDGRVGESNDNDVLWVDGNVYTTIAGAVTAAGANPRLIIIPSTYSGTECPASVTSTITFWDLRNGTETCEQNSVSWNQTSPTGLHSMMRAVQTRSGSTTSETALYGQGIYTGALPAVQALVGTAGECDIQGAVTTPGNTTCSGVESDVVMNATGGTLFQLFGLTANMSSRVGNTTNVSSSYGVYIPEYVKNGSETVTNDYGLVVEAHAVGTTNNIGVWDKSTARIDDTLTLDKNTAGTVLAISGDSISNTNPVQIANTHAGGHTWNIGEIISAGELSLRDISVTSGPYWSYLMGGTGTFGGRFNHANTATRTYTFPDATGTVDVASATSTTANFPLLTTTTAGVETPSTITFPTSATANGLVYASSTTALAISGNIGSGKIWKETVGGGAPVASSLTDGVTANLLNSTNVITGTNTVRLTANSSGITALTPGTAVLTFPTLPVSTNLSFHCHLMYNQQTTAVAGTGFAIQSATTAATRLDAMGNMYTSNAGAAVEGVVQNLTTTTATPVVSGTPSAITTVFQAEIDGSIQVGATAGTLQVLAFTGNASDSITVQAGSYCSISP